MTLDQLRQHIATVKHLKCDTDSLEAKAAVGGLPQGLWRTLSAFSNTRGGAIILGLAEAKGEIVGVKNAAKLQQDLGSMCSDMEPVIRPEIQSHRIDARTLITAEVPEIDKRIKPCFYRSAGYTNGAFVRVSDGNRKLSQYEVHMMLSGRGQPKDDEVPVPKTTLDDLQPRLVKGLVSRLRRRPNGHFSRLSDERILRTIKVLVPLQSRQVCSLAGLLALGKYPQQFFPALGITFVVYPGTAVGEPGTREERFLDNERIDGAIPDMLAPTLRVLRRNMRTRSVIQGLYRSDLEEYPITALREAIVNALAHRDLSTWGQGTPVQVQLFSDRLAVHNPGGLYGPVTIESLGRDGISASRNLLLLQILEDTPVRGRNVVCENRGSGIGAMVAALRAAGLPDAEFEDKIATFRVTLFNTPTQRKRDRRGDILSLLQENGDLSTVDMATRLNISAVAVRKWLVTLRREGSVIPTEEKATSKNVRYRLVTK
jgi:ATP-dependent DNA helicase RecG